MMKNIKIFIVLALTTLLGACAFEHPEVNVLPDPIFSKNGLQQVTTNSIYEDAEMLLNATRIYGLSKELALYIEVDESILTEYNSLYGTNYTLLDPKYYELPESATFAVNSKKAEIPIVLHPKELVKDLGLAAANNVILPMKISGASLDIQDKESLTHYMLNPLIESPVITPSVPNVAPSLSFVPTIPLAQELTLTADANFNTLDVTKVSWQVNDARRTEYNAANNTSYELLPATTYTFAENVFDAETGKLSSKITFDCASIGGEGTYLLPLELKQTGVYTIQQTTPVYILVNITALKVWLTDGGGIVNNTTGKGTIKVEMNTPMTEAQNVDLAFDEAKVAAYNTANSTSYPTLAAEKVVVTPTSIEIGKQSCNVDFNFDIAALAYDDGNGVLIPLTLKPDVLVAGSTIIEPSTVYVLVKKSIAGAYDKEVLTSQFTEYERDGSANFGQNIQLTAGLVASPEGQKYAIAYNQYGLLLYFDVLMNEPAPGHAGCVKLGNFRDRPEGFDEFLANDSYMNPTTGELFFDFVLKGTWNTTKYCVRLYNKQ